MGWGRSSGGNSMPTPSMFEKPNTGMFGTYGTYTDWNAYNSAVMDWRQKQEQGRFDESRKLLSDVMALYQNNGALDQSFQNSKNKFMSKTASDMVMRGMGNMVNMPAVNLAYEKEVRPEFEIGKQARLAQAMTAMANLYANYNPSYEQFAQPMSVTRVNGGSAFGGGNGGYSGGSGLSVLPASSARPLSPGYSTQTNPVAQELDRMTKGGSNTGQSPFVASRPAEYMMGSDPDWRAANSPGMTAEINRFAQELSEPMFANNPYLKTGRFAEGVGPLKSKVAKGAW